MNNVAKHAYAVRMHVLPCVLMLVILAGCGGNPEAEREPQAIHTPTISSPQPTSEPAPALTPTEALPQVRATVTSTAIAQRPTPTETQTPPTATPPLLTETSVPGPEEQPLVIVLDPGHDRSTPGALGIEYQYVLRTAFVAKAALEAAGYEVHLTREDNDFVFSEHLELLPPNAGEMHPGYGAAYAHASKALQFEPDLVLLLHYNGHPNPGVRGVEIYYCEMGGPQNLELAGILSDELVLALRSIGYDTPSTRIAEDLSVARGNRHFPSLGNVYDPPQNWVESRYDGIPVVLTEPLYMTNALERPLLDLDSTHRAIADAYVRAIDRYFGR